MSTQIAVLGSGYAGAAAVKSLESELNDENADVVWISREPHHFILHEAHRCIRDPGIRDTITIPIDEITSDARFIQGTVTGFDVDNREIALNDGSTIEYDYAIVCLGSQTAFYGIDGLKEHSLTLKSLGDALTIHEQVAGAARDSSNDDPAQVVIGGAGLTGIQTAGEVATYRDEYDAPIAVYLIEQMDEIFPGHDNEFQGALQNKLEAHDIDIQTGATVETVDETSIDFESGDTLDYDVFVWAGGVSGQDAFDDTEIETDHNRAYTDATLKTSDDRVFAIGDAALVDQEQQDGPLTEETIWQQIVNPDTDNVPPPTAEAAMEEGEHVGANVARTIDGRELLNWAYVNKGTTVSVGDDAVANNVIGVPINTFSGPGARFLEKLIAVRWIGKATSWERAIHAWREL